jgi:ABC-2 type transport system permease protein
MTTDTASAPLPSVIGLGVRQARLELTEIVRDREALFFTMLFPIVLLVLFGSIFGDTVEDTGVEFSQVIAAGLIGSGIYSTSFLSLAIGIAYDRDQGVLKRWAVAPLPKTSFIIGKIIYVLVTSALTTTALIVTALAFFGLDLPSTADRWFAFAWVFVLGVASGTVLGIAFSAVPKSAKNANAIVQPPFIVLQFISGVFVLFSSLPIGLQQTAALFPLKWLTQGLRSVFLPDTFQSLEMAGSWEHGRTFAVLAAWTVAGFAACLLTFRWKGTRRG